MKKYQKAGKAKAKDVIAMRFKPLKNGGSSIYLDYYKDGRREYEFLKMYLIPELTPFDKIQNEVTLNSANAIKAERVREIAEGAAGIKRKRKNNIKLSEYLEEHLQSLSNLATSTQKLTKLMIALLNDYCKADKLMLSDIDVDFCRGFINFLLAADNKYTGQRLTKCSADNYYTRFVFAINEAVRKGYIDTNPTHRLTAADKIKPENSTRTYLTIDEVRKLIETDCKYEDIKKGFLFSCFCGLRMSDIRLLKWGDIEEDPTGGARISIVQQKTGEVLYLNISEEAKKWLPSIPGESNERVFNMGCASMISRNVDNWANAAGIKKHVTFHTARHTFATMLLTLGGDIYTVSKLLGHKNIQTTQIYAKIIDQKKKDTVNLVNGLF